MIVDANVARLRSFVEVKAEPTEPVVTSASAAPSTTQEQPPDEVNEEEGDFGEAKDPEDFLDPEQEPSAPTAPVAVIEVGPAPPTPAEPRPSSPPAAVSSHLNHLGTRSKSRDQFKPATGYLDRHRTDEGVSVLSGGPETAAWRDPPKFDVHFHSRGIVLYIGIPVIIAMCVILILALLVNWKKRQEPRIIYHGSPREPIGQSTGSTGGVNSARRCRRRRDRLSRERSSTSRTR